MHASSARPPRRSMLRARFLERLESRDLLTVEPITVAAQGHPNADVVTGISQFASVSRDGQVVAFQSSATDLVTNDVNGMDDIYVYFPSTSQLQLVSVNAIASGSANRASRNPRVSPDGRYVLFESDSTDIVLGAGGFGAAQLFARDLQTNTTILVTASPGGGGANRQSSNGFWSADSTKVVFESLASNLVTTDNNNQVDIFLRDLVANTTRRVSERADGGDATTRSAFFGTLSFNARLSGNGRYVVFNSFADNLGPVDGTVSSDVYLKDLQTNAVELISIDTAGVNQPNGNVIPLSEQTISNDGRFVIFNSSATNLIPGQTSGAEKVFLRDRVAGTLRVVSAFPNGTVAEGFAGSLSPDGRYVAFVSAATLDSSINDTNGDRDVFLTSLETGDTKMVSVDRTGQTSGNGRSGFGYYPNIFTPETPRISDDGRWVSFASYASNLTDQTDTNNQLDVFRRDMISGTTVAVSDGTAGINTTHAASSDLETFVYETADNGHGAAFRSLVVSRPKTGTRTIFATRSDELPEQLLIGGGLTSMTPDGRYVAFHAVQSTAYAPAILFQGFQTASSYVRDRRSGAITVVDLTPDGKAAAGGYNPKITPDGRFVAFTSRQPAGGSPPLVNGITFAGPVGGFFSADVYLRDLSTGKTRIVSVDPSGTSSDNGRGGGQELAVSDDGRYVTFTAAGDNLVAGISNPNGQQAIYQRDTWTNTMVLVSRNLAGNGVISGASFGMNASSDGRYVSFLSRANDLATNDTNNGADVFRWDRQTGQVELVSRKLASNTPGNGDSGNQPGMLARMTPDGRFITFASLASDLVTGDANNEADVFVRDMTTGQTRLVSVASTGNASGNGRALWPTISIDGSRVTFMSSARNLTNVGTFGEHVFVRDLQTNTTEQISVTPAGLAGNGQATTTSNGVDGPTISPNGRYVAFRSYATNLVEGMVDANANSSDLFVRDLITDRTMLVTENESGTATAVGSDSSYQLRFADDGTFLFDSDKTNLYPGDRNATTDIFAFHPAGIGRIRGTVFQDADRDGLRDVGETGLNGIPVYLDLNNNRRLDRVEPRLQTDAAGEYAFNHLAAGSYVVRVQLPDGTTATTTTRYEVTLATDSTVVANRDFGGMPATVDLKAVSVIAPSVATAGRAIAVSWTTANAASEAASGDWQDAIYLSADDRLDATDLLLGTVPHTGGLDAHGSYSRTATFTTPATQTGNYFVFVQTDRRNQVAFDTNRANNLQVSSGSVEITIPTLILNTPTNDSFTAANQDRYFQIQVDAGQTIELELNSAANAGETELYARFHQMPTPFEFDVVAREANQADQRVAIALTRPGTYYVLARSRLGAAATSPFTMTARGTQFQVDQVSPASGGNTGRVTVEIRGKRFTSSTVPTLVRAGTIIAAQSVDLRDASLFFATFDLTGQAVGNYDVRLRDGDVTVSLASGFSVVAGSLDANPLRMQILPPQFVRAGRQGTVIVEFENISNTDVPAPLLRVTANDAILRMKGATSFVGGEIYFLGISQTGLAGTLAPGQRGQVELEFQSTGPVGRDILFDLLSTKASDAMDWNAIKSTMKPHLVSNDAWEVIFANIVSSMGTTVGEFQRVMAANATYLSSLGTYTPDLERLLALEYNSADGTLAGRTLAQAVDLSVPAPGFDLTFHRWYVQSIHGRYALGRLGRGWVHEWDREIVSLADGVEMVRWADAARYFYRSGDSYVAVPGDNGVLTKVGNALTLTELDGTITRFLPGGKMEFVEDAQGNRVTATYDANTRLIAVRHSSGAQINVTYNAQGRISSVADSIGRSVSYAYDAVGEHLTSYTDRFGTHQYRYLSGQGLAREHALASITFANERPVEFSYDERGRLVRVERSGGQNRLTYQYGAGATLRVTDATNATSTIMLDDRGQPLRSIDALGRVTDYRFDEQGNLISSRLPGALEHHFSYDASGNLLTLFDASGNLSQFSYDADNQLTSFTDSLSRTTQFQYDSEKNLSRLIYPDGTERRFAFDGTGAPTSASNRRGGVAQYEYNAAGLVTKKTTPDGQSIVYAYDNQFRMISATDSAGKIEMEYGPLDLMTKITYPNGRFLRFEYNARGDRSRTVDQSGFTTNYSYDNLGHLDQLTDASGILIVDYDYDAAGRLIRQQQGNGNRSSFAYDAVGQLLSITHADSQGTLNSKIDYAYDSRGRRTSMSMVDRDGATTDGTTQYGYDPLGQLNRIELPGGRVIAYEYDAVGNRIAEHDNGVTTRYVTNARNEYIQVGDSVLSYDADGNLVSSSDTTGTTRYTFDQENRLRSVVGPGINATYQYDALGHRWSETTNGQTSEFLIDPMLLWNASAEYGNGGNLVAHYVWGLGLTSRIDASNSRGFYDYDAVGNTLGVSNATGAYANRYDYLPFGELISAREGIDNRFQFGGAMGLITDASNFVQMRYRNYDPAAGRFVSNDPAGLAAGDANVRRYAMNNPTQFVDPMGLGYFVGHGPAGWNPGAFSSNFQTNNPYMLGHSSYVTDNGRVYEFGIFGPVLGEPAGFHPSNLPPGHVKLDPTHYDDSIMVPIFQDLIPDNIHPFNKPLLLIDPRYDVLPPLSFTGDPLGGGANNCHSVCQRARVIYQNSQGGTKPVGGLDPNDIVGPTGAGPGRHVLPDATLPYTIRFENQKTALAPAQEVFVTHPLDEDLDLSTFELREFGFGDQVIEVPRGLQAYQKRVDYQNQDGSPLTVELTVALDAAARQVIWTFRSLDPDTGLLPDGVFDGFLPPNQVAPTGEGFVRYFVRPKLGLASGTRIDPVASIVFDVNEPIVTPPTFNTIDAGVPTSQVTALPSQSATTFTVSWNGSDEAGGSGIAYYDIFVSNNGGSFTLWNAGATQTSAVFTGVAGHTYRFYSVAVDLVGHREVAPPTADTQTQANDLPSADFDNSGQVNALDIDLLCAAIQGGNPATRFDLDESGVVNAADAQFMVKKILRTSIGDANLDGIFDSSDLVQVFQAGVYEDEVFGNAGWEAGDWDCDGDFTTADLIAAFQDGGYERPNAP